MATLPLALKALSLATYSKPVSLRVLCQDGEPLIVAAGIAAAALGELFKTLSVKGAEVSHGWTIADLFAGGSCLILTITSSFWYGLLSTAPKLLSSNEVDTDIILEGSVLVFSSTVFVGLCCIVVAEVRK